MPPIVSAVPLIMETDTEREIIINGIDPKDVAGVEVDAFVPMIAIPADLAVTKTDSRDPVLVRSDLTYALKVVTNASMESGVVTGVVVTGTVPGSVDFVLASPGCA